MIPERFDGVGRRELRFFKQIQPILGLIAFFQCDLQLGHKIGFPVSVIRLMDVRADGRGGPLQLVYDGVMTLYRFAKPDSFYRKLHGKIDKLVFFHFASLRV